MSDNQTPNEGNEDKVQVTPDNVEDTTEKTTEELEDGKTKPEGEAEEINYEEKFTLSQKEAIRLHKENKKLQEEAVYTKNLAKVSKNKDSLKDIYEDDHELAERISQELFEESYDNVFDDSPELDQKKLIREELDLRDRKKEKEAIEDYEVKFFAKNEITPGTEEYKKIMNIYHDFEPKTLKKAKTLLSMAAKAYTDVKEYEEPDAPVKSFSSSANTSKKDTVEEDLNAYMNEFGIKISPEAMKKAKETGVI
jgi:hypothetical protein